MCDISVTIERWEDGIFVKKVLQQLDRWEVHAAENVIVTACEQEILLAQKPALLPAAKVGVGACIWDSAIVLAAHIAQQPRHKFLGTRCVELGAGAGLVGILLAKLGAQVTLTDLGPVVHHLLRPNIERNNLARHRAGAGNAEACELVWGTDDGRRRIEVLKATPLDFVIAADSCYDDQDGLTPNPRQFFEACRNLCSKKTLCLLAVERRNEQTFAAFMACAAQHFSQIKRLPHAPAEVCKSASHIELYALSVS